MGYSSLVQLLRENIAKNKVLIHKYYLYQDFSLDEKIDLERLLFASVFNISIIPYSDLEKIVDGFSITLEEKKTMKNQLRTIVTILKLNSINGTNMVLDEGQMEVLNIFLRKLHEYISERREFMLKNNIDIEKLTEINDRYKALATTLSNPKNTNFISDMDSLITLFDEVSLPEEERQKIIVSLIKYNRNIFNSKNKTGKKKVNSNLLDTNKVKENFKKYGYDFSKLSGDIQDKILEFGKLGKIKEVLCTLSKLGLEKLDEGENGYQLMSLVLASDKETIGNTVKFALKKRILNNLLVVMPSAFISSENNNFNNIGNKKFKIMDSAFINNYKPYIVGCDLEFRNNALLLEKYGLSVKYVLDKCPLLLMISSEKLSNNLELFLEYGFSFNGKKKRLVNSALMALTADNFSEIVDQFIEIHPFGVKYLRDNLSSIKTVKRADDILFYNIYYSRLFENDDVAFRRVISNNTEYLCICGNINDRFRKSYYGINDSNKREITNTIIPIFNAKNIYLEVLEKDYDRVIDVSIFDNEYIQKINVFSDEVEPLIYNFGGIRISKIKVLRVFNILIKNGILASLDSLLFAITYNTIISAENYERLSKMIRECL